MAPKPTGDGKFRGDTLTISSLVVNTDILEDLEFSNCRLIGPAVLLMLEDNALVECNLGGPSLDALFWDIRPGRNPIVGAVGVRRCTFSACTFQGVGFAGGPDVRATFESVLGLGA